MEKVIEAQQKLSNTPYYIGLDMGSNSIGFAVTDENYNVLSYRNKRMIGTRLIEEAQTNAERRVYRSNRRRLMRKKERVELLNALFEKEIIKIDKEFFNRMQESNLKADDRSFTGNILLGGIGMSDKEYYKKYKTIYHLRRAVMSGEVDDMRLVYLAVHHIIKYRGNFLREGQKLDEIKDAKELFIALNFAIVDIFDKEIIIDNINEISDILLDGGISKRDKKSRILEKMFYLPANAGKVSAIDKKEQSAIKKQYEAIISGFMGGEIKLNILYNNEDYKDFEKNKFTFNSSSFEDEVEPVLKFSLGDDYSVIEAMKNIYEWTVFRSIIKNSDNISEAMIAKYEKHEKDLRILKSFIKENYTRAEYLDLFGYDANKKQDDKVANYSQYVGMAKVKGKKYAVDKKNAELFYAKVKKLLKTKPELEDNESYKYIISEIENNEFMPKQLSPDNGVIPYQLNEMELEQIIKKYPFFSESDGKFTIGEKLLLLLKYRVPYYVGPLNTSHRYNNGGFAWAVRKKDGEGVKITPWNFEDVIDREQSATVFIERMTNQCTYLRNCKVIPQKSILYSQFMLLNEINKIKLNNEPLTVDIKKKMVDDLFLRERSVTKKKIVNWLIENNYCFSASEQLEISGIDDKIKANLASLQCFRDLMGGVGKVYENLQAVENIIKWITVFNEKSMVITKIEQEYPNLFNENQLKQIKGFNFSGWSNLSRELLELKACDATTGEYLIDENGEYITLIDLLYESNDNLNEILHSSKYTFMKQIEELNGDCSLDRVTYNDVEELYCSPIVKRVIWQTMKVVNELVKVMGHEPTKIFIEMARDINGANKKERTKSRREQLLALLDSSKEDVKDWINKLNDETNERLQSEKLYLYYTQLGKCMYTGKQINLSDLMGADQIYDIDHIYPQAIVKDDSILNNKVLVVKESNSKKKDNYPLPIEYRTEQNKKHWKYLKNIGLITEEKYSRLVRTTPLTDEEYATFIGRQIVDTRQSTKEAAKLFGRLYKNTEILYVKGGLVSNFRDNNKLIKVRELNDLHHAKDAYLNIVVGDIYYLVYGQNPIYYVKEHPRNQDDKENKERYNFEKRINNDLYWKKHKKIVDIKKEYARNDILVTRMSVVRKGQFYDMNLSKAKEGLIPITENPANPYNNTAKYGGYNSAKIAYFFVVEYDGKKSRKTSIAALPIYKAIRNKSKEDLIAFAEENGYKNPKIIIEKLPVNSLLEVEGKLLYLTAKTGDQLQVENANQIYINEELMLSLKNILKLVNKRLKKFIDKVPNEKILIEEYENIIEKCKNKDNKDKQLIEIAKQLESYKDNFLMLSLQEKFEYVKEIRVRVYDKINNESLTNIYNVLTEKLCSKLFIGNNLGKVGDLLKEKREDFNRLDLENKCVLINELLKLLKCDSRLADLRLIGGVQNAGKLLIAQKISGKKVNIIYPSVTGLYQSKKENITKL